MAANKKDETGVQNAVSGEEYSEKQDPREDADDMEALVEYMAPVILGKADQTVFCQVNGENIRIQRGKKVKIKRKFKQVLDQSAEQELAAYAYMEQAQSSSAKALADLK